MDVYSFLAMWRILLIGALSGPLDGASAQDTAVEHVATTSRFEFASDVLLNLHHFLYEWARHAAAPAAEPGGRRTGPLLDLPELAELASLSDDARGRWSRALDAYREHALPRDLLFDAEMIAFRDRLAAQGAQLEPATETEAALIGALRDAREVYEERWWPVHDGANHAWLEQLLPLLERHEAPLAERLVTVYGGHWPEHRIRVDVCAYANWAKAYTAGNHALISSTAAEHQGSTALEVLFHEASHTPGIAGAIRDGIRASFDALATEPPRDLWHVVLFHTAGDAIERALGPESSEAYVHLGTRNGVYERGPGWPRLYAAVREHWQPHLDGLTDAETAYARLAAALSGD